MIADYSELWIIVYAEGEKELPCYECGLHRSFEDAEETRVGRHSEDGITTKCIQVQEMQVQKSDILAMSMEASRNHGV